MAIRTVYFDIGNTLVTDNRQWNPGASECLHTLKEHGVRLGLISNTGDWTRDELQDRLPEDFDFAFFDEDLVLLSSEVGVQKPDLSIFLLATSHAGCSPWQILFVGENLAESLTAQTAGMMAVRLADSETDFQVIANRVTGDP